MKSGTLRHDLPTRASQPAQSARPVTLTAAERTSLVACVSAAMIAYLFPYPVTKILLGTGLAVLFLALSLRHFYIAIALFVFFLPLQELLPGSFFVRGLNTQTMFVVSLCALSVLGRHTRSDGPDRAVKNVIAMPLWALVATILLSALHSSLTAGVPFEDSLQSVKNAFIYAVPSFLTFSRIREDRQKAFVLMFILVAATLTAADSVRAVVAREGLGLVGLRYRATSIISGQPNLWGGFLAMYAFFFISAILYAPISRMMRALTYGALGIVLVNLVYTQSRGAWLAFGITGLLVTSVKARRMLVPLMVLGVALYLWNPTFAVDRFQSGFRGEYDPALLLEADVETQEAASRIIQWRSFLPLMSQYGIVGAGFGRYARLYYEAGYDVKPRSAHATVIETGIEQGMLGLIFYFWLFGAAYRRASAVLKEAQSPVSRTLALGLVGATLCLLLLDVTGVRSRDGKVMAFYWILAGMTLNIPLKGDRARKPRALLESEARSLASSRRAPRGGAR
jgi:hypothetical protein